MQYTRMQCKFLYVGNYSNPCSALFHNLLVFGVENELNSIDDDFIGISVKRSLERVSGHGCPTSCCRRPPQGSGSAPGIFLGHF